MSFEMTVLPKPLLLRLAALLPLLLNTAVSAPGQETDPKKDKAPLRTIRFLPLGEAPPFQQEVRDGVRYELEPPVGSVPPREIVPGFSDTERGEPVLLNLGRMTFPAPIPAGAGFIQLRKKDSTDETHPWLTVQRPEQGNMLVVLWRDPRGKNWDQPAFMILPDGPGAVGARGVLLLNLTPSPLAVTFGQEKIALPSGRPLIRQVAVKSEVPLEAAALNQDGRTPGKRFHSTALTINNDELTRVIFYRADGATPRTPVKVSVLRERIPDPAAP